MGTENMIISIHYSGNHHTVPNLSAASTESVNRLAIPSLIIILSITTSIVCFCFSQEQFHRKESTVHRPHAHVHSLLSAILPKASYAFLFD